MKRRERHLPLNSQPRKGAWPARGFTPSTLNSRSAFTLVEVMVVMTLLTLIVIALMGVFSATQSAFRASVTQTDVLESGRAAMELITRDLRTMSPSGGVNGGAVNFYVTNSLNSAPLIQSLTASGASRTNVQQNLFILSQGNLNGVPTWYGTGYTVLLTPTNTYTLYRYANHYPVSQSGKDYDMFHQEFQFFVNFPDFKTNTYSRLLEGVVGFRVSAFDLNGGPIDYIVTNSIYTNALPGQPGQIGYVFYSNAVPATVEIEMSTLEDRALQRAESRPFGPVRTQYLSDQSGRVHVFRQRVAIPNVVPAAYQ
ncbi:MAG TPA: prepilin-type N-terminal cleavage/methylation domain-containing protein [Verrucomicrobiae bacterium]|nr:prepilin-type N-terminal cleavage/methylation domain-containing protein [Verrucomicrobiae bacterium]